MARAVGDGLYVLIVDVVVTPRVQGRGIGAMLIAAVVQWAGAQSVPHLALGAADELSGRTSGEGSVDRAISALAGSPSSQ